MYRHICKEEIVVQGMEIVDLNATMLAESVCLKKVLFTIVKYIPFTGQSHKQSIEFMSQQTMVGFTSTCHSNFHWVDTMNELRRSLYVRHVYGRLEMSDHSFGRQHPRAVRNHVPVFHKILPLLHDLGLRSLVPS